MKHLLFPSRAFFAKSPEQLSQFFCRVLKIDRSHIHLSGIITGVAVTLLALLSIWLGLVLVGAKSWALSSTSDLTSLQEQVEQLNAEVTQLNQLKEQYANLATPSSLKNRLPDMSDLSLVNSTRPNKISSQTDAAISLVNLGLSPSSNATESVETLRIKAADLNERLRHTETQWLKELQVLNQLPTGSPIANNTGLSSNYGTRIDPFTRMLAYHSGIDFAASLGAPILASGDGTVIRIDVDRNHGQFIEIAHGSGFTTLYAHVSSFNVKTGDVIKRGQSIAAVGSTGRSTSPHLHYEIHYKGIPINPMEAFIQTPKILTKN